MTIGTDLDPRSFFYLVLSYPRYSASLLASNDFLRSCTAAGLLHAGPAFFKVLHVDGGVSLLAGGAASVGPAGPALT
jgi:hypothetical protein